MRLQLDDCISTCACLPGMFTLEERIYRWLARSECLWLLIARTPQCLDLRLS
jgi:hypothetical protein